MTPCFHFDWKMRRPVHLTSYMGRSMGTSSEECFLSPLFHIPGRIEGTYFLINKKSHGLCSECDSSSAWPLFGSIPHRHAASSWFSPTLTVPLWHRGSPPAKATTKMGLPARRCIFRDTGTAAHLRILLTYDLEYKTICFLLCITLGSSTEMNSNASITSHCLTYRDCGQMAIWSWKR